MNRFVTRLSAAVVGLVTATTLAGCGTGQISQTANQAPAVNGTGGVLNNVSLRNVRIHAEQTGDQVQPGQTADLLFVVSNQSPDAGDELTGVQTDIGKVAWPGAKSLPAGGMLIVGTPTGADVAPANALQKLHGEKVKTGTATIRLDKPISNGLTYDVTFNFANAGSITLAVPISAGLQAQPVLPGDE